MFVADRPGFGDWPRRVGIRLFFTAIVAGVAILDGGVNAATKALEASDFKLCTVCNYDLRRLPSPGVCPECGEKFRIEDVEEIWKEWLVRSRGPAAGEP
jgi:hypothetical protein